MENLLSQQEIDEMVRAARSGTPIAPQPAQPQLGRWDPGGASQIGREHLEAITVLHEGFARNLTNALAAYLRVGFSATLVSAEHLGYREFLASIPDTTYLASCRLNPMGANALLQWDLKIAFAIIELLLGGEGAAIASVRELTEIEEQILDGVARILCRELGMAWKILPVEVSFERRLESGAARRLMSPEDKMLCLSFEVSLSELRGNLNIAVPVTVSQALLRKLAADWSRPAAGAADHWRERLMHLLLDCPVAADLATPGMALPISILSEIVPGEILALPRSAEEPASLLIAGLEAFHALPARSGNRRAARLLERQLDPRLESRLESHLESRLESTSRSTEPRR
jgi:flagellar motor switch protein FliM